MKLWPAIPLVLFVVAVVWVAAVVAASWMAGRALGPTPTEPEPARTGRPYALVPMDMSRRTRTFASLAAAQAALDAGEPGEYKVLWNRHDLTTYWHCDSDEGTETRL